jgi:hypothetical protein
METTSDPDAGRGPPKVCQLVAATVRNHLVPKRFRPRPRALLLSHAEATRPAAKSSWVDFLLYGRRPPVPESETESPSETGRIRKWWPPRRSVVLLLGVPALLLIGVAFVHIFSVVELLFSMVDSLTRNQTPSLEMRSDEERLIAHIATARGIMVAPFI